MPCLVQVISTARTCNLILIVLDCLKPLTHKKLIEHELEGFGIRLNKKPPNIAFRYLRDGWTCVQTGEPVCPSCLAGTALSNRSTAVTVQQKEHEHPGRGTVVSLLALHAFVIASRRKKDRGGINFTCMVQNPKLDLDAVKAVCAEYRWVRQRGQGGRGRRGPAGLAQPLLLTGADPHAAAGTCLVLLGRFTRLPPFSTACGSCNAPL